MSNLNSKSDSLYATLDFREADTLITSNVVKAIHSLYSVDVEAKNIQLQPTRKEFEGDYTLVVFPFVSISHSSPESTANAIGEWLKENVKEIASFNVIKGFLNISLSCKYWLKVFYEISSYEDFGKLAPTGKTVMVEFSSPNTNKPLHLGHIRNNLLGSSVSSLLEAGGNKVIKVTLVNDRGIHICKSMLAWEQLANGETPQSSGKKGDHFVGDYYVAFNNLFLEQVKELVEKKGMDKLEAEKEAACLKQARDMLLKWEQGDKKTVDLWRKMNAWVLEGFDQTYKELGISFDKTYFESDTYILGKELVKKGLDMEVFEKEEDGSVWCDLTKEGLDRKLLLRGDGTSVYITQDLGTAHQRFTDCNLDSHIYVVGDEQNYHFQVLKAILKKLAFPWNEQIYHLSYGMVELPEGKMKSREGTVVDADDLIEKMYEEAKSTSEQSEKLSDLSEEQKSDLYKKIALAALKYFILKVDPKKTMLFNPKESIDFNGNTGPFIQYTHARICSILKKSEQQDLCDSKVEDLGTSLSSKEVALIKLLYQYPIRLKDAAAALSPSLIANYSYELSKEFNQYYHETPILKEEDRRLLRFRLLLISKVAEVLRKAMAVLGIELPERM